MSQEKKRTQYDRDFLLGVSALGVCGPPPEQETIRGMGLLKSTETVADDIRKQLRMRSSRNECRKSNGIFINYPNVHLNQNMSADRVKIRMQVKDDKPEMRLWNQISWRPLIINFLCPFAVKKYVGSDEASTTKSDFIKSIEKETQKIFENVTPTNFETMKKSFGYLSLSDGETKEDDLLNATVGVVFNVVLEGKTSQPDWTSVQHLHVKLLEAISRRGCFWEVSAKLKEHITLNVIRVMFRCYQEYSDLQKLEKVLLHSSSSNDNTSNDLESDDSEILIYSKMKFRSRERSLRLMQFIAALYNSQLLIRTPCNSCQVIVDFIALHLQFSSEQNLEYICELLSLVNFPRLVTEIKTNEAPLYSLSVKGSRPTNSSLLQDLLNQIYTLSLKPSVSPRVRFSVHYLMDLYNNICKETSKSLKPKITPSLKTVNSCDNVSIGSSGDQCGRVPVPLMSLSIHSPLPSCSGRKRSIAASDSPHINKTPPLANVNVESQVAQDLEDVLKSVVHMDKKSGLKDAAKRTNILLQLRVVDRKTILKLLAHEIVKQFQNPELDPPQATTNIANFLTELFCSEESLNWLAEVGTIIEATQSLQTSSMWRVVAIHCLTNLKQMLTLTQLTDALRRTERRDLIPLPKNFAGLAQSLNMTAPKIRIENEMETLNLNEQVTPQVCNLNQNGARDMTKKRDDYLNWSDYFMGVAFLSAMRSKDPSTQVGACIVNDENKIVGIGYNGMPNGCSDDDFPWGKDSDVKPETKYMYVCHAEMNAILNKIVGKLNGCRMYVALFPCNECAKLIIQSGIKEVYYLSNKNWTKDECIASRRMLDAAGIKYSQYTPKNKRIVIDFESIDWNKDPQLPPSPVKN